MTDYKKEWMDHPEIRTPVDIPEEEYLEMNAMDTLYAYWDFQKAMLRISELEDEIDEMRYNMIEGLT